MIIDSATGPAAGNAGELVASQPAVVLPFDAAVGISFPTGNLRQLPQLNYTDRGHIATAIGNDRSLGEQEKAYVWNQIAAPLAMLPSMDDARAAIRKHEENEGGGIVRAILGFNTGDYNA